MSQIIHPIIRCTADHYTIPCKPMIRMVLVHVISDTFSYRLEEPCPFVVARGPHASGRRSNPRSLSLRVPMQSGRSNLGGAVCRLGIFRTGHPDPLTFGHLDFDICDLLFEIATPRQVVFHQGSSMFLNVSRKY